MSFQTPAGVHGYSLDQKINRAAQRIWTTVTASKVTCAMCATLFVLLCAYLSYKAVSHQITETQFGEPGRFDRSSLMRMIEGTAHRPFAFRVLTPNLVNLVWHVLPIAALTHALPGMVQAKLAFMCTNFNALPIPPCEAVTAFIIVDILYFLTFLLVMAAAAQTLVQRGLLSAAIAVGLAYFMVTAIILLKLSLPYDYGTLMFGSLLLLCLAREWDIGFCVVLVLAFLNKESAIIYGLAFVVANWSRLGPTRTIAFAAVQGLSYIVLHGAIRHRFRDNGGEGVEMFLQPQIYYFMEHLTLGRLVPLIMVLAIVFFRFAHKAFVLRRASIVILPWFALYLVGGQPGEIRLVFEVFPVIVMLATDSLVSMIRDGALSDRARMAAGPGG